MNTKIKIKNGEKMRCAEEVMFNAQHDGGYHDDGGLKRVRYVQLCLAHAEIRHFKIGIPTQCVIRCIKKPE